MTPPWSVWLWGSIALFVFGSAYPGRAQDTIDRPVTIYVAGTAGGGVDLYARLLARHISRHIPGKPTVTVQVMPGAGGNPGGELSRRASTARRHCHRNLR